MLNAHRCAALKYDFYFWRYHIYSLLNRTYIYLQEHTKDCPRLEIECPNGCGIITERRNIQNHCNLVYFSNNNYSLLILLSICRNATCKLSRASMLSGVALWVSVIYLMDWWLINILEIARKQLQTHYEAEQSYHLELAENLVALKNAKIAELTTSSEGLARGIVAVTEENVHLRLTIEGLYLTYKVLILCIWCKKGPR